MIRAPSILLGCVIAASGIVAGSITASGSSELSPSGVKQSSVISKNRANTSPPAPPAVMPIISRGVPAFASPNIQPNSFPSYANDDNYSTHYRSQGLPAWVAYDLSSIPASHRQKVLTVYYNCSYAYNIINGPHYNNLREYSIQGNAAGGSKLPPNDGWVTLASMRSNTLHSRQQIFNLRGYNWLRLYITLSDGSYLNYDADFNQFDIYDLSRVKKPSDDWIFYGDSIAAGSMVTCPDVAVGTFAEFIHQVDQRRWPVAENGGEPFDTSTAGLTRLRGKFLPYQGTGYLSIFPGRYVALCYGMNDADSASNGRVYYNNMKKMVKIVLAARKIPIIPKINYTNNAKYNRNIPVLNRKIDLLYKQYPKIVKGPDFWTYFQKHTDLVEAGDIHPTALGYAAMRRMWATTMLSNVYRLPLGQ